MQVWKSHDQVIPANENKRIAVHVSCRPKESFLNNNT